MAVGSCVSFRYFDYRDFDVGIYWSCLFVCFFRLDIINSVRVTDDNVDSDDIIVSAATDDLSSAAPARIRKT